MESKCRIDVYLAEKGLCPSREKAKAVIMSGQVYVNSQKADKPGIIVLPGDIVEVRGPHCKYVSRGGLKLEKALSVFNIDVAHAVCMDIGASTGGFTDCMLQNGAEKVYSVDVGYGQLDWKLRSDERVVCMERTNIRYIEMEKISEKLSFITADVSFISLKHIFPVAKKLMADNGQMVCLVKPQFEAGREKVGKKGVVRDPDVHIEVIKNVITMAEENGLYPWGLDFSPIKGPEGNIEFLLFLKPCILQSSVSPEEVVKNAHFEMRIKTDE